MGRVTVGEAKGIQITTSYKSNVHELQSQDLNRAV